MYSNLLQTFDDMFFSTKLHKSVLPYNIEYDKENNDVTLNLAVAGYPKNNIKVTLENNLLKVICKAEKSDSKKIDIYNGLCLRSLEFVCPVPMMFLVDKVELENGLLKIKFKKNTELKPVELEVVEKM